MLPKLEVNSCFTWSLWSVHCLQISNHFCLGTIFRERSPDSFGPETPEMRGPGGGAFNQLLIQENKSCCNIMPENVKDSVFCLSFPTLSSIKLPESTTRFRHTFSYKTYFIKARNYHHNRQQDINIRLLHEHMNNFISSKLKKNTYTYIHAKNSIPSTWKNILFYGFQFSQFLPCCSSECSKVFMI